MSQLFDAHVIATPGADSRPAGLHGATFFGGGAAKLRVFFLETIPAGVWKHAETLSGLVGPADPRFPNSAPELIDLTVADAELQQLLAAPQHTWFPLLGGNSNFALRLNLPPTGGAIPLVKKLARGFPRRRFLVDPFLHGPKSNWVAQLRLAECENLFLTTLGLPPGPACTWPDHAMVEHACHFVSGEVGAGKLLFASGANATAYDAALYSNWLERIASLDSAQRELVAWSNAATEWKGLRTED